MIGMFKGNVRTVLAGVCCAAVMCLENVMSIEDVNRDMSQDTDGNSHSVDSVCSPDNIKRLASSAVDNEEAMKELVEILCAPTIDFALADLAYWSFQGERDRSEKYGNLRCTKRCNLLDYIRASKEVRDATDAKSLWEKYKKYRDVPYTVREEDMEYFD